MPKSKTRPAARGKKLVVREARPGPRPVRDVSRVPLNRDRPAGGRPPRMPGRLGGR